MTDSYFLQETENLRRKMVDSDIVVALLARMRDKDANVHLPICNAIKELAKYGKFHPHSKS